MSSAKPVAAVPALVPEKTYKDSITVTVPAPPEGGAVTVSYAAHALIAYTWLEAPPVVDGAVTISGLTPATSYTVRSSLTIGGVAATSVASSWYTTLTVAADEAKRKAEADALIAAQPSPAEVIASLTERLEASEATVATLSEEKAVLVAELTVEKGKSSENVTALADAEISLGRKEEELKTARAEHALAASSFEATISDLTAKLAATEDELAASRSSASVFTEKLTSLRSKLSDAEAVIAQQKATLDNLGKAIVLAEGQLSVAQAAVVSERERAERALAESASLRARVEAAEPAAAELTDVKAALATVTTAKTALESEVSFLRRELGAIGEAAADSKRELNAKHAQEVTSLQEHIARLSAMSSATPATVDKSAAALARLTEDMNEYCLKPYFITKPATSAKVPKALSCFHKLMGMGFTFDKARAAVVAHIDDEALQVEACL